MSIIDLIRRETGVDCAALPLTLCRIPRPYLLERSGLLTSGTAILFAVPYVMSADASDPSRNLSLYAVPRDYHLYVRELSERMLPALRGSFPAFRFALFADHSPIFEVEAAARAGLGIVGLNHLLITPEYGSFVFLMEVITDADLKTVTGLDEIGFPQGDVPRCEGCGACLTACPASCGSSGMDACLSGLTQKKGELTGEEKDRLRAHPLVWGCDICQLACPHNKRVLRERRDTPVPFFREDRITRISTEQLAAMNDEAFASRAFAWRGRKTLLRNLALKEAETTQKQTERSRDT